MSWERSVFCATPGNVPVSRAVPPHIRRLFVPFPDFRGVPDWITGLFVPVAWGTEATPPDPAWLVKARERFTVYAWAWCDGKDVEGEARVHALAAAEFPGFSANMEEPFDAHGDSGSPKYGMPKRYLDALDYAGDLCVTTTAQFGSDMTAWINTGALSQPQAFELETGVGLTEAVDHAQAWGWPLAQLRPLVQSYPTNGARPDPSMLNLEATTLGVGAIPYTVEQATDPEGVQWLNVMRPTIERPQPKQEVPVSPDTDNPPAWSTKGYPGGPMVKVKGFPRPMYPPDAKAKGKTPSKDGPDVVAYKRTVSRAGRWTWQKFDDTYSDNFAHGKDDLADSGVAGVQRQQKIDATGWIGEKTFNTLRSIRIPEGLPHAGEPAMDATAVDLLNDAYDMFQGESSVTRCRLSDHFIVEEFDCNDGTLVPAAYYEALKWLCRTYLEPLHAAYGPVTVNSGYRTSSYNASIGGASNSFHIYTNHDNNDPAADVSCAQGSAGQWHSKLDSIRQANGGNGGLGLYSTFCHIDMRDYPSDWSG